MARIGIIGAGAVGTRLAALWRAAGHDVRAEGRAGAGAAVAHGEVAVLALPYVAAAGALPPLEDGLAGKVVIDVTNPLGEGWAPLDLGPGTSAAEEIARLLPRSAVVKAFNTVFADIMDPAGLSRDGTRATCFVAGDDSEARATTIALARDAGFAPVEAGPLRSARYLEAMAHLNIAVALGGGGTDAALLYHRRAA